MLSRRSADKMPGKPIRQGQNWTPPGSQKRLAGKESASEFDLRSHSAFRPSARLAKQVRNHPPPRHHISTGSLAAMVSSWCQQNQCRGYLQQQAAVHAASYLW